MSLAQHIAEELPFLRVEAEALMTDACVRRRYAPGAVDEYGNPTDGAVDDATYPCRKIAAPGNEDTTDRDIQTHDAAFVFPLGSDVVGSDELIHDGVTWQVLGPPLTQSWPIQVKVLVRRSEAL